jgi:hypothetical protein
MSRRFDSLEERLESCSSWAQQTFRTLEALCRKSGGKVTSHDEAKCEGRLFRVDGSRSVFCRIDPKIEKIGLGFSNNIRHLVAQTGRLRDQKKMAWITLRAQDWVSGHADIKDDVAKLIHQANELVCAGK